MKRKPLIIIIAVLLMASGIISRKIISERLLDWYDQLHPGKEVISQWHLGRQFNHVLIIILENTDYEDALREPFLRSLAARGTVFSNFHALTHPSYPNYLAMVAGRTFGIRNDEARDIDARTIADLLARKGFSWKQYTENYPGSCDTAVSMGAGLYKRKHAPFINFTAIQRDRQQCANIVAASGFDRANMPNYSIYVPNMCNDGHDCSLRHSINWLQGFLEPLLNDRVTMKDTLIVVTFDEGARSPDNHILTLFLGGNVRAGYIEPNQYTHYNVLRTIEENFGLSTLNANDLKTSPIISVWRR